MLGRSSVIAAAALLSPAIVAADWSADDFQIEGVAAGLEKPVALAVAPDGRIFVTEQAGRVRLIVPGSGLLADPFAELPVHEAQESGLLGIALDPDFAENGHVYVLATVTNDEQQIIRLTASGDVAVDPVVIRDQLPSAGSIHNGGGLKFGPDGRLYFTIGDNGQPGAAQDPFDLRGKLCRINIDGTTPTDNPFATPTGAPSAVFALGLRNPFRFTFAPDGRAFVLDVGSSGDQRREEINIAYAGDNFGWPAVEGFAANGALAATYKDPAYAYSEQGSAVTGAVYYTGHQLPARVVGDLLHLEFVLNRLYRLELAGDTVVTHELLVEVSGGPTDLAQDTDGSLLYCAYFDGAVKRIRYVGPEAPAPDDPEPADAPDEADDGLDDDANGGIQNDDDPSVGGGDGPRDAAPLPLPACGFGLPLALAVVPVTLVRRRRL